MADQIRLALAIASLTLFQGCRDMRKRFLRFTFERESHWMVVVSILVPLLAILLGIVTPALWRRWFP